MWACPDCQLTDLHISYARPAIQCADATQVSMWTPLRLKAPIGPGGRICNARLDHVNWGLELNYLSGALSVKGGSIQADGPDFPLAVRLSKDIAHPVTFQGCQLGSSGGCIEQIGPRAVTNLIGCRLDRWGDDFNCIDIEHGSVLLTDTVFAAEEPSVKLRTADAVCKITNGNGSV